MLVIIGDKNKRKVCLTGFINILYVRCEGITIFVLRSYKDLQKRLKEDQN